MNRRQFFTRVSTAAVGVCVASKIPTTWLPAPIRHAAATEYLRAAWLEASNGQSGWMPREMYAGRELYDAFNSELIELGRYNIFIGFGYNGGLKFKTATVLSEGESGWYVRIPSKQEWEQETFRDVPCNVCGRRFTAWLKQPGQAFPYFCATHMGEAPWAKHAKNGWASEPLWTAGSTRC